MFTRAEIQHLVRKYQIIPSRKRGQNFLVDHASVKSLLGAADLQSSDTILEIGAGLGVVTIPLAQRCASVIAVEVDRALEAPLRLLERRYPNLRIVRNDILQCALGDLVSESLRPYKIIASLPFNITSHFIQKVLTIDVRPQAMTLIIQYEVAERIVAEPGAMSLLSLSCQLYSQPRLVQKIPASAFWPQPDVDAAIIHFANIQRPSAFQIDADLERRLFHLAHAGFSGKRKQLRNTLSGTMQINKAAMDHLLDQAGIAPQARPQELSVEQWIACARVAGKEKE
ncbi:MAG: 16S rRNA (adenine(1518)-N(6)/adenine(1519)-N(6))-dimethyltransferase RsmA [Patescibacteria group bacterium]